MSTANIIDLNLENTIGKRKPENPDIKCKVKKLYEIKYYPRIPEELLGEVVKNNLESWIIDLVVSKNKVKKEVYIEAPKKENSIQREDKLVLSILEYRNPDTLINLLITNHGAIVYRGICSVN